RARTALTGLAIPPDREVVRLMGLNQVDGIQHDHPFVHRGGVGAELSTVGRATPDSKRRSTHYLFSSMMAFSSAGISGIGARVTFIVPSRSLLITRLKRPYSSTFTGWSSRKCAPRLSRRSRPARAIASETMSRLGRSSAVCQPALYSRLPMTFTDLARFRRSARVSRAIA